MIALGSEAKVFLAIGATDMRKGMDGLATLVAGPISRDPFSGHVFAFCNRQRNTVKLLRNRLNKRIFKPGCLGGKISIFKL